MIEALKSEGRVTEIPSGRSIDEIWEDVRGIVDKLVAARSEEGTMQEEGVNAEDAAVNAVMATATAAAIGAAIAAEAGKRAEK